MNEAIISLISVLANLLLPADTWTRLRAVVERWDDKLVGGHKLSGIEKKQGVLDELELLGIHAAQWIANALIDLAVMKLRIEQGKPLDIKVEK